MSQFTEEGIRSLVRNRYAKTATGESCACGGDDQSACCSNTTADAERYSAGLGYTKEDIASVPQGANMGLGCGNPHAIAQLKHGDVVLDLGSGGGFDCFLAAQQVGPTGKVIGVDMTPEMVSKARNNVMAGSYENVEFRLGEIENLPVADNSIDIILSNCVINLSPEKPKVFREALRVLKPGGRIAISDILALQKLPDEIRKNDELLCSCVGGAETVERTKEMLRDLGFDKVEIAVHGESREFIKEYFPKSNLEEFVTSATIQAFKPLNSVEFRS